MMRQLRDLLFCTFVAMALAATASAAENGKTIVYNLTTDESWSAGMALGQANKALEKGYKVVILLNVRGVFLAAKGFQTDKWAGSHLDLRDMLEEIVKYGGRVIVCPLCLQKAGLGPKQLIEGVELGGPEVTLKLITGDDTVVISY